MAPTGGFAFNFQSADVDNSPHSPSPSPPPPGPINQSSPDKPTASAASGEQDMAREEGEGREDNREVLTWTIDDMLDTLPYSLSYDTLLVPVCTDENDTRSSDIDDGARTIQKHVAIPRRELFDVRMQLMNEDWDEKMHLADEREKAEQKTCDKAWEDFGFDEAQKKEVKWWEMQAEKERFYEDIKRALKKREAGNVEEANEDEHTTDGAELETSEDWKSIDGNAESQFDADPFLGREDVRKGVYEGGLKSWECAADLVDALVLEELVSGHHVVELGCGTALPTLALFQKALMQNWQDIYFTFADYNMDVLRLVTFPNLFLTWIMVTKHRHNPVSWKMNAEDINTNFSTKREFRADLDRRQIYVQFVSGPWGPDLHEGYLRDEEIADNMLVLASETIYEPENIPAFAESMCGLLKKGRESKALVAAKRMYFGVGGGVEEFARELSGRGVTTEEVKEVNDQGVSRVVLKIT
ncbi:MAG: hypothetical protein M1833_004374 [Piccolia ochrophora]|nr:MAG: hypothetical protein M1833_004374 [Piccolia ochrophora]